MIVSVANRGTRKDSAAAYACLRAFFTAMTSLFEPFFLGVTAKCTNRAQPFKDRATHRLTIALRTKEPIGLAEARRCGDELIRRSRVELEHFVVEEMRNGLCAT